MDKLKFGETAVLVDGKEYICFTALNLENKDYVGLISNTQPIEVLFARQVIQDGNLELTVVEDRSEKERLVKLFKEKNSQEYSNS